MIRRSTLAVLVIFILLIALVWYLQTRESPTLEATPTAGPDPVLDLEISDVAELRIISSSGAVFRASRDSSGVWTLLQPSIEGQLNGDTVESNLSQILDLRPLASLDSATGMEAVGLISPQYVIRLTLVDGGTVILDIGDETPTSSGFYVRLDNTEVLVAQKFAVQSVFGMVDNIPLQPTPTPIATDTPVEEIVDATQTPTP